MHQVKENLISTANYRNKYKGNLHNELSGKDFSMIMINTFKKREERGKWGMDGEFQLQFWIYENPIEILEPIKT